MRDRRRGGGRRGFILVEALVAIVILGAAIGGFLLVASTASARAVASRQRADDLHRIQDALATAAAAFDGRLGAQDVNDGRPVYRVEYNISNELGAESAAEKDMLPIRVDVSLRGREGTVYRLSTMILARRGQR